MKHSSYNEYFSEMKKVFNRTAPMRKESRDKEFKKVFLSNLLEKIKINWTMFENGEKEDYMITDSEFEILWDESVMEVTSNMIQRLSDLGLINMGINSKGEMVYSISEEGVEYLNNLSGK